jgi:hypothetical protein
MTIPKRTSEIIEEQLATKYAGGIAGDLGDAAAGLGASALAQGGLDVPDDVAAAGTGLAAGVAEAAPGIAEGADAVGTAAGDVVKDVGTDAEDVVKGVGTAAEDAGKGLWGSLKGLFTSDAAKSVGTLGLETNGLQTLGKDVGSILGEGSSPYEGAGASTGGYRAGPMLTSSKKNAATDIEMQILDQVKDIPKLLEMILENLCNCGQPTAGKFNGMPHCVPGSGCANNIALSATNPTGDNCCSCGNPNCSGSFHGQPICAPGQGCNDHWDVEKGARKWSPAMETPAEKIADHDNWASSTNHGEFEMPDDDKFQTTWE